MFPWKLRKRQTLPVKQSFISTFFTWQVSACELQPFSCHDLANDIYLQTAKTVFSHLTQDLLPCTFFSFSFELSCQAILFTF